MNNLSENNRSELWYCIGELAWDQVAIDLISCLAVRVPEAKLDVLKTTTLDLDNPIYDRTSERVGCDVVRLAGATISPLGILGSASRSGNTLSCSV